MHDSDMDRVIDELLLAFPTLASDVDRVRYLRRTISGFSADDVRSGILDYLDTGEKFVETGRFFAIVNRHAKQRAEREAVKAREHSKLLEMGQEERIKRRWDEINATIEAMSEPDLASHKAAVLVNLNPDAREFLEKRDPRKSATLKGLIYDRITGGKGRAA